MGRWVTALLCLIGIAGWLRAVGVEAGEAALNREAEALFGKAVEHYKQGRFLRAQMEMEDLLARMPGSPRASAAQWMLGKTLYKLGQYDRALAAADQLKGRFPQSRYRADADFLAGDCHFRKSQYALAASAYLRALDGASDPRLRNRALERVGALGSTKLSPTELQGLRGEFGAGRFDEAVAVGEARWLIGRGFVEVGRERLRACRTRFPDGPFVAEAQGLLGEEGPGAKVERRKSKGEGPEEKAAVASSPETAGQRLPPGAAQVRGAPARIGLICPLSGDDGPLGEDLRDGARLALEHFTLPSDRIELAVEDATSDPVGAVKAVRRLVEDDGVLVLIGPIRSASTVGAAAAADARRVPLIAPTASEHPIAEIGPYIFQLNTTPEVEGGRLAEYAVVEMGLKRFEVLASLDAYGRELAGGFADRVKALGGEVVAQEWYFPGAVDFTEQIGRMHEAGFARIPADTTVVNSLQVSEEPSQEAVPERRIWALDGLLIASSSDTTVALIAPQLAFHQVRARLLGGSGWNSPEVARLGGGYVEGAVFVSGYFEDRDSPAFRRFSEDFSARFRRPPGVVTAFGYDAVALAVEAIRAGGRDREGVRAALEGRGDFAGASGVIVLRDRMNVGVHVLKIQNGGIVPLGRRTPTGFIERVGR